MRVCVRLIAAVRASFFCRSASSSAFNHLTVKTGSRGGGQSASAKLAYVMREGNHAHDAPEREHVEHGNMPAWAQDDPRAYWSAADENERANGALFKEIEFALPKELHAGERCEVAHRFAEQLTDAGPAGKLPYTLAIHRGDGENPHAHLLLSERANDGIARRAEQWFKRANTKAPETGGAKKWRDLTSDQWVPQVRATWAATANNALDRAQSRRTRDLEGWNQERQARARPGTVGEAGPSQPRGATRRGPRGRRGPHAERRGPPRRAGAPGHRRLPAKPCCGTRVQATHPRRRHTAPRRTGR